MLKALLDAVLVGRVFGQREAMDFDAVGRFPAHSEPVPGAFVNLLNLDTHVLRVARGLRGVVDLKRKLRAVGLVGRCSVVGFPLGQLPGSEIWLAIVGRRLFDDAPLVAYAGHGGVAVFQ